MTIAVVASAVAAAAWLYLLAGHGGFWRTDVRLPPASADPPAWPSVVAVVPARDEAAILPETLPALLAQRYQGRFTVALVDDQSTDGTADIAAGLGRAAVADGAVRFELIGGDPLVPGWAGKVWAMSEGLRAAAGPGTDYVLFTDADIWYAPGTVAGLVRAAEGDGRALVSQMALLRADSAWERLLIPGFVYFFAQLYPFRWVNRRGGRTAAAAGGCMLVRRAALDAAGGLEPVRGARIDDVALGGLIKRTPGAGDCWLGFSTAVVSRRRYDTLAEIWDMVARSAYTQLRYSPALLAATVLGMTWLYLAPVAATLAGLAVLAVGGPPWLAISGAAAWAIMAVSYVPVLRLYGLSALRALGLPVVALLYTAMTVSSAWRHRAGRGGKWKGRTIQPGRRA